MGVNAAWADLAALADNLSKATGTGINMAAAEVIQQTAQRVQGIAQSLAPIKSGALKNSIKITYPEPLKAVIGPEVEYGAFQEYGTGSKGEFPGKPYTIRAKNGKKALSFVINGKRVFVSKVRHPGVKPHPYMRPAFEQALGDLTGRLADAGAAMITRGWQ